jgi:hypothetical protein
MAKMDGSQGDRISVGALHALAMLQEMKRMHDVPCMHD